MGELEHNTVHKLASDANVQTKEQLQKVSRQRRSISLGIPKEKHHFEKRVALTPHDVKLLSGYGFKVIMEKGAGDNAFFTNSEYSESGADLTDDPKEVYQCDIICKISFPELEEIKWFKERQILLSALDLPRMSLESLRHLFEKKITAICFEYLRDESGVFPVIQSMSEIAGQKAIQVAGDYMSGKMGKGQILGGITGIPPSEVVIIGAGTVGQYAAKTALALGASVKMFDTNLYRLKRLENSIGARVYNSLLHTDILEKAIINADVVIGALRSKSGRTPVILTEDMVMKMKEGAVLVDVSIDQGGCFETSSVTTIEEPYFIKHGIVHYCVPNIPSLVPQTASLALGNILTPVLKDILDASSIDTFLWERPNARNGVYVYKGILTNLYLARKFNLSGKSLDILLTTNL